MLLVVHGPSAHTEPFPGGLRKSNEKKFTTVCTLPSPQLIVTWSWLFEIIPTDATLVVVLNLNAEPTTVQLIIIIIGINLTPKRINIRIVWKESQRTSSGRMHKAPMTVSTASQRKSLKKFHFLVLRSETPLIMVLWLFHEDLQTLVNFTNYKRIHLPRDFYGSEHELKNSLETMRAQFVLDLYVVNQTLITLLNTVECWCQ